MDERELPTEYPMLTDIAYMFDNDSVLYNGPRDDPIRLLSGSWNCGGCVKFYPWTLTESSFTVRLQNIRSSQAIYQKRTPQMPL